MRYRIRRAPRIALFGRGGQLILQSLLLLFLQASAYCLETSINEEGVCGPDREEAQECTERPIGQDRSVLFPDSGGEKASESLFPEKTTSAPGTDRSAASREETRPSPGKHTTGKSGPEVSPPAAAGTFVVHFFWGKGCPHCEDEKHFLEVMKTEYPSMKVLDYEVWYNKVNAAFLAGMARAYKIRASGVPITFIGRNAYVGFSRHTREEMGELLGKCESGGCVDPADVVSGRASLDKAAVAHPQEGSPSATQDLECTEKSKTVYIPWIGNLDTSEMSLPVITLVIAGLDSFNPCAFFVLFSLLGLLIHARSRFKMFLIGSEFVFFSGFIYFLFMTAWLNVFLLMGEVEIITKIAGAVAVIIAAINIKDFFIFKKGVSLTIPDGAKPKLFDRMRRLMKSTSLPSIVLGTAVLAIAANSYELLCTAGFPMVYTRILTLKHLSDLSYYLYLILYNLVYVVPLSIIVIIFTVTLGRKFLSEQQGRMLKLISGNMMLGLGAVLLLNPALLNNAFVSFLLLLGTFFVSAIIALVTKKMRRFG